MLLDSNILIYGGKGEDPRLDLILDRFDLAVASVTLVETLGFHGLSAEERHWLEITFERMRVLPLDSFVVRQAIALRQQRRIALADAIIAGTAMVHNLPLVTRNTADFRGIPGLQLVDPFTSPG